MNRRQFIGNSSIALSATTLAAGSGQLGVTPAEAEETSVQTNRKFRLIATEEAFATPEQFAEFRKLIAGTNSDYDFDLDAWRLHLEGKESERGSIPRSVLTGRLLDIDNGRIEIMDQCDIDMHVLSLTTPGVQMFTADVGVGVASVANDRLAQAVAKHPTRFAGLASFAPQDPDQAAKEIDRAIGTLKLNGLIVNSHTNGEYFDDPKFWPIFEAATHHDAAIYIHPRNPPRPAADLLKGGLLGGAIWGYQQEVGLHAMRMIIGGVFDRFPTLKIVLGHMGEGIPYWVYRIDHYSNFSPLQKLKPIKRKPSEYLKDNFLITTSGSNYHPTLKYCHEVLGPENIMFAIDYPYQESLEAANFINSAPLRKTDIEMIAHGNAERLFRISLRTL